MVFNLYPPSNPDPEEFAPRDHPGDCSNLERSSCHLGGEGCACVLGARPPARTLGISDLPPHRAGGTKDTWERGGGAAVSGTSLGLSYVAPPLSYLVCKIGAMVPSLPTLQGLHKASR